MSSNPASRLGGLAIIGLILVLSLAQTLAQANSNYWQNVAGDYNGSFSDAAHWSLGAPPTTTDYVFFNNLQSTPYTVKFTGSVSNGPLRILDDSVTFDLNGYRWAIQNPDYQVGSVIGTNSTYAMTVRFGSTANARVAGGNVASFGTSPYPYNYIGYPFTTYTRSTRIVVDDSLGYPVTVIFGVGLGLIHMAEIVVGNPGSEFSVGVPNGAGLNSLTLVTNGAVLSAMGGGLYIGHFGSYVTATVIRASVVSPAVVVGGYLGNGTLFLRDGSTWTDGSHVQVGDDGYGAGPYRGNIFIDGSTFAGQCMTIGGCDGNPPGPGQVWIQNGSTATLAKTLWITITNATGLATCYADITNLFVLENSTLYLGGGAVPGTLRNQGIMRITGTIAGQGSGTCVVQNEGLLDIGAGMRTLAMSNAQLENLAAGKMLFEFSTNNCDMIDITGGTATIGGTCVFSTVSFAPAPRSNRTWDFVRADSIVYTAEDNLTNLMTAYNMQLGGDYAFGVVDFPGGRKALRLRIYPQPSMMLEVR